MYDLVIIGFGISGIVVAKYAAKYNLKILILEKSPKLGGVWYNAPNVSELQTRKHLYEFSDYPMPKDYPKYPKKYQILAYLRSYITKHTLEQHVEYNSTVINSKHINDIWHIKYQKNNKLTEIKSKYMAVCGGYYNNKRKLPNEDNYTKKIITEYNLPLIKQAKKILIVGNGASACDFLNQIVSDNMIKSRDIELIYRTEKYYINKYYYGIPFIFIMNPITLFLSQNLPIFIISFILSWFCIYKYNRPNEYINSSNIVGHLIIPKLSYYKEINVFKDNLEGFQKDYVLFENRIPKQYDLIINTCGYTKNIDFITPKIENIDDILIYNYVLSKIHKNCGFIGYTPSYNWLIVSEAQAKWFIFYILNKVDLDNYPKHYSDTNDLTYDSFNFTKYLFQSLEDE
tara:strand:- start:6298 stop:7497 length:1200 start_codon:yes stop_codon:yes gene_type:complete